MQVKVSNMCRIVHGDQVLVQNRTKNDWPGITFPGGKVENNESIYDSCIREVKEETGLTVWDLQLKGMIHYQLIDKEEKWIIYLYETSSFEGVLHQADQEDEIFWMPMQELATAPLSNDLHFYLQMYEQDTVKEAYANWNGKESSIFTYY